MRADVTHVTMTGQDIAAFEAIDIQFARFIQSLSSNKHSHLFLAAALVSKATREGHVCLKLEEYAGKRLAGDNSFECPGLREWVENIVSSSVVGRPGEFRPLILDESFRLYMWRYWDYEARLIESIRLRVSKNMDDIDPILAKEMLRGSSGGELAGQVDWQKVAIVCSMFKGLCVISGGPGTGKTTTAARIMAMLIGLRKKDTSIALCAPTGKAAARLKDAIDMVKAEFVEGNRVPLGIPDKATTIHRLLGYIPGSPYFIHDQTNPLSHDVVVVDESSMVDIALLSKLVQAMKSDARLILIGDKDQLASVESGAVLGDICDTGISHPYSRAFSSLVSNISGQNIGFDDNVKPGIQDSIIHLEKSYRFSSRSGIAALSRAVITGKSEDALKILLSEGFKDVEWKDIDDLRSLENILEPMVIAGYSLYLNSENPYDAFNLFDTFRILTPLREGPFGVKMLNAMIENILSGHGLIETSRAIYPYLPLLITRNDYNLHLFNGDVGIIMPIGDKDKRLMALFRSDRGGLRHVPPARLPEYEHGYVMSVHKSQGSEFDSVLLVLPLKDAPVLTRELIYTAITRAKKRVAIWGTRDVFKAAVGKRIERNSGLRDALWR